MVNENAAQLTRRIAAPRHTYDKAIRNNTGVNINRYHFWPAPSLVGDTPTPRATEYLTEAHTLLTDLVSALQTALANNPHRADLSTAQTTRFITHVIRDHLIATGDGRTYAELHIPFRPGTATHPGRVDLALLRPGKPDILIEIDHEPKSTSEDKLRFIANEGGIGIWIRWDTWHASAIY